MSFEIRQVPILHMTPFEDHTGLEGYFVKNNAGLPTLVTGVQDIPFGLILDGEVPTRKDSIMFIDAGGPSFRVKVGGAGATANSYGTLNADGSVQNDPGAGGRTQVCRFIETGVPGELVEAVVFRPVALT